MLPPLYMLITATLCILRACIFTYKTRSMSHHTIPSQARFEALWAREVVASSFTCELLHGVPSIRQVKDHFAQHHFQVVGVGGKY